VRPSGWQSVRPGRAPDWLAQLEPLTTGLLSQSDLKLWCAGNQAALGIRAGGVVYPVWREPGNTSVDSSARQLLDHVGESWCIMGPSAWVEKTEALMPASRILRRVVYDFLFRQAPKPAVPVGLSEVRSLLPGEADLVYPLQEAYEKEEVLFDPSEYHPVASRIHWALALRHQEMAALWENGDPVAKAGTNALTKHWAQIGGVYTKPERRGQGLQKRLLAFLIALLADQGRSVCLFVKKENSPALALYKSLDFRSRGDFLITYGQRRS